jgi:thioredoxin reductase (NADPH)
MEQIVIIGSGPAACSAAVYAARANLHPLLFEGTYDSGLAPGGQLTTTTSVDNYLGLDGMQGPDLASLFLRHAQAYGCRVLPRTVTSVCRKFVQEGGKEEPGEGKEGGGWRFVVQDSEGGQHQARSVVLATGANAKRLGVQDEGTYWNRGISACAVCDAALPIFRDKVLVVVGGGDTAMEEACFLTKFASKVIIVHRSERLRASAIMLQKARSNPKIKIQFMYNCVVKQAVGDQRRLAGLLIADVAPGGGGERLLPCSGLFYAIGHQPNTKCLDADPEMKERLVAADGYVFTQPGSTLTAVPGLFACGDVQDRKYRQAITAAGSGCQAALDANHFLEAH